MTLTDLPFLYSSSISPRLGLKIAIADCDAKNLVQVGQELISTIGESNVLIIPTDVSKLDEVVRLRDKVYETWGEVRKPSELCGLFYSPASSCCIFFLLLVHSLLMITFLSSSFSNGPHIPDFSHPHATHYTTLPNLLISPSDPCCVAHFRTGRCAHEQCWGRR